MLNIMEGTIEIHHVLQSTTERFPDSHLGDRVGHFSHGNMLAVQGRI